VRSESDYKRTAALKIMSETQLGKLSPRRTSSSLGADHRTKYLLGCRVPIDLMLMLVFFVIASVFLRSVSGWNEWSLTIH